VTLSELTERARVSIMKIFANWKNIIPPSESFIPGVELQSHRIPASDIQFVVDIPDEVTRDEVLAKWIMKRGITLDSASDGLGFEEEWPPDVQSLFYAGHGDRYSWSDL
jgi:hypothetical protein